MEDCDRPGVNKDSSDDFVDVSNESKRQPSKRRKRSVTKGKGRDWLRLEGSSDDFVEPEEQFSCGTQYGTPSTSGYTYRYKDSYLALGFTWTGNPSYPYPMCIVCWKRFANSTMVPSKMRKHLETMHSYVAKKDAAYFKQLLKSKGKQRQSFVGRFTVSEKAQKASYLVAELIAQKKESYTIGVDLIMPACKIIVGKVLGEDAVREIERVPLSSKVISQHVKDMSVKSEAALCERLRDSNFSIKVHTSGDSANKCHIITVVRYVNDGEIQESFLSYKELPETNQIKDIFHILSLYIETKGLSWKNCVGFHAYSGLSAVGVIRSCASLVKRANPNIITHCFLHRHLLLSETLGLEMKKVLQDATKIMDFLKQSPSHSQVFKELCKNLDKECINLLLHTESFGASGEVLDRLYDLKDPLLDYFTENGQLHFAECFRDDEWIRKLAYLADIFQHIKQLNESLQEPGEHILAATDKVLRFKYTLNIWRHSVAKGKLDMFPLLVEVSSEEDSQQVSNLIVNHLDELRKKILYYFPSISTQEYGWVREPYSETAIQPGRLTLTEEEELCELQSSDVLRERFAEMSLEKFWVSVQNRFPNIHRKAVNILLQFSSSYSCEKVFSCLASIKNTDRNKLVSVEDELRMCLS